MSDSLDRLFRAVIEARRLDPRTSRTARLLSRGQARMAKKLAEEAFEVVIDAVAGNRGAVVRESADLLYNLTVLWVSAGVKPGDVWAEMDRRETLLGIAEKLPKVVAKVAPPPGKAVKAVRAAKRRLTAPRAGTLARRPRRAAKRHTAKPH